MIAGIELAPGVVVVNERGQRYELTERGANDDGWLAKNLALRVHGLPCFLYDRYLTATGDDRVFWIDEVPA